MRAYVCDRCRRVMPTLGKTDKPSGMVQVIRPDRNGAFLPDVSNVTDLCRECGAKLIKKIERTKK